MNRKQLNQLHEIITKASKAFNKGELKIAEKLFGDALKLAPADPQIHYNWGLLCEKKGDIEGAFASYRKAIEFNIAYPDANFAIFRLYVAEGRREDAYEYLKGFLRAAPVHAWAWRELGIICSIGGKDQEAEEYYARAMKLNPQDIAVLTYAGSNSLRIGNFTEAVKRFSRLLEIAPDIANNWLWRGLAYYELCNFDTAILDFKQAIVIDKNSFSAWNNIGSCLLALGQAKEAKDAFVKVTELKPDYKDAWRNLAMSVLYIPGMNSQERFSVLNDCAKAIAEGAEHLNGTGTKSGKIKVGYISADFRSHPVARNMKLILGCADREAFSLHAYVHEIKNDNFTMELNKEFDSWNNILGLSDKEAALKIKEDGIDILVLLAGRFDRNRPGIMAFRPAPVQVSFHDAATLGMPEIDYIVSDSFMALKSSSEIFVEKQLRIPSFYLHGKIDDAPDVNALPMLKNGYLTFICCNSPAKIGEEVLELWEDLLDEVTNSKIILKYRDYYNNKSLQNRIKSRLGDRVEMQVGEFSFYEHLKLYNQADIALDVFPFSGSTTSFEALCMGVPVITLTGENMVNRWTGSMLKTLNMDRFIANSDEEYINIAKYWSNSPQELSKTRSELREVVYNSSLTNGKIKARQLEKFWRFLYNHHKG